MEENVEKREIITQQNQSSVQDHSGNFFKNAFTKYISVSLSIIGLILYFIGIFIGLVSSTMDGAAVSAWFAFLGWGVVVSGLLVFAISCIKNRKFEFSPEFIFSIISIIIVTL